MFRSESLVVLGLKGWVNVQLFDICVFSHTFPFVSSQTDQRCSSSFTVRSNMDPRLARCSPSCRLCFFVSLSVLPSFSPSPPPSYWCLSPSPFSHCQRRPSGLLLHSVRNGFTYLKEGCDVSFVFVIVLMEGDAWIHP